MADLTSYLTIWSIPNPYLSLKRAIPPVSRHVSTHHRARVLEAHTAKKKATSPDARLAASYNLHAVGLNPGVDGSPVEARPNSGILLIGTQNLLVQILQRNNNTIASDSIKSRNIKIACTANSELGVSRCQDTHHRGHLFTCVRRHKASRILPAHLGAVKASSVSYFRYKSMVQPTIELPPGARNTATRL